MMHRSSSRRLAVVALLATSIATLAVAAPAHAGVVQRSGTVLSYTSSGGQADQLILRQLSATTIMFDDVAPVTTNAGPACVANAAGNVVCSGVAWTRVTADLRDGDDTIIGQQPNQVLQVPLEAEGGPGTDQLIGGNVGDQLDLGADGGNASGALGNDVLRAGPTGTNGLNGGEGNDLVTFAATTATAVVSGSGGPGDDTMRGGAGRGFLFGNEGTDDIVGGAGNETLDGGAGIDTINGGDGDDEVEGGSIAGAADGADTLAGGPGSDALAYRTRSTAVRIDLTSSTNGQAGENDATALDFEAAVGGSGPDVLLGNDAQNLLDGRAGNDQLDGRGGTDQVFGGANDDTIDAASDRVADIVNCGIPPAGTDADTANLDDLDILELVADCETVTRAEPPAPDTPPQTGNALPNRLVGTARGDLLSGRGGDDTLRGLAGNDLLRGGLGNDRLFGGPGNDDLDGDAGNDSLFGDAGSDTLDGGPGRDVLRGGPGIDTLVGGRGVDNLDGGPGKDYLYGTDGARFDVLTCTRVNLANRFQRRQRDVVVASRGDVIVNRAWCAKVTFG